MGVYEQYKRGEDLLASGDPHAATVPLEAAVASEPDAASLREVLGRAYYGAGRFIAALEQFDKALELHPNNHYALCVKGLCLAKLGRLDEAGGHLKMALVMRPDVDDYALALARIDLQRRLRDRTKGA